MRVLFLDIDGVLNDENTYKKYMSNFHYNYENDVLEIDTDKIQFLSYICNKYRLKVVISSAWKLGCDYGIPKCLYQLVTMLYEAGIDVIGMTPNIPNPDKPFGSEMWKEWDIECYLYEHPEVKSFVILDDENYDLHNLEDYLVKTEYLCKDTGLGGLLPKHENPIRKALLRSREYKR